MSWSSDKSEKKYHVFRGQDLFLFSTAFLTLIGSQVAASIIVELKYAFPDVSGVQIELVYSIVSFISFLTNCLCSILVKSKKRALLMGVLLFTLGGILTGIAWNYPVLMLFRIITGIGTGMITPLLNAIVADLKVKDEESKIFSKISGVSQAGSIFASMGAGFLASFSWRASFLLFLTGIPALFFIHIFMDNEKEMVPEQNTGKASNNSKIPIKIWKMAIISMSFSIVFTSIFVKLSLWAFQNNIPIAHTGVVISMPATGAMLFSWVVPTVLKRLKRMTLSICWLFIGTFYFLLSQTSSVIIVGVLMFLFGVFGNMHSIVITSFTGKFSDKEQSVRYMALINAAGMIGSFLCPFLFALSQKLTDGSIASGFKVNGFESIALGLFCFVVSRNFD